MISIFNRRAILCGVMVLSPAVCAAGQTARARSKTTSRKAISQPVAHKAGHVIETANFRIYGISALSDSGRIADQLESLRNTLGEMWLDQKPLAKWSPKCEVVVHATVSSYTQAVGQDQFATVGASQVEIAARRILRRRIDVRATEGGWFASAVPHELTHLILADEFLGGALPAWADEGMAVLADTSLKQSLHARDFRAGRASGTGFRLIDFVGQSTYPAAARIPVFYGQSASLVKFLAERKSRADFVRFLHRAEKVGYDAAVTQTYGLSGLADLERQWLAAVRGSSQPDGLLASADTLAGAAAGAASTRPPLGL